MSRYSLNSIAGYLTGAIPAYNMEVKYTSTTRGEWSGRVYPDEKGVEIISGGSSKKVAGCNAGYSYVIASSGNVTADDYQTLMHQVQQTGGTDISLDWWNTHSTKVIFQIPFDSGYLTFLKIWRANFNQLSYYVCASPSNLIDDIIEACNKDGVGYEGYSIMTATAPTASVQTMFFLENYEQQNVSVLRFGGIYAPYGDEILSFWDSCISMPFDQNLDALKIGSYTVDEFDDNYGNYSTSGGYGGGSFDDSSDSFGLPGLPSLGVSEVGFINVYNPSKGQLQGFADELFPDFELPEPSTKEGLEAIADNLAKTFSVLGDFAESYINAGLVNYVIDCHIVPVKPSTANNSGIKVGFKTFNYSPAKVTSDYVEYNCGSLSISEYYQNFLDYEGTRAKLYLPFIGFVDIKPEWFQSGKLEVVYHFNIIDGSCISFIIATSSKSKLKNTVVATFGGNCCVHMPITGVNYSSMISGVVGGIAGVASSGAKIVSANQNDNATLGGNIEGTRSITSNFASALGSRPTLEQSNGYNAGMSFMCYRRPYLLIERPVASFSKNYPHEQGLPLNVTKKLSSIRGFTTCENANLDGINCTEEERGLLKEALRVGCIF